MLEAAPAFSTLHAVGHGGGVRVRLLAPPLVSVLARAGQAGAVMDKARAVFGLALRDGPYCAMAGAVTALGIGPGRWLFLGEENLRSFAGLASLSDQSDGYALFALCGPQVRAMLAKGVALDLENFTQADSAVTAIAHIGVILWRPAPDMFVVAVFRSYAGSFWHWLCASAAEYGLAIQENA